ncbi:MAG: trypsin-like peptidase domain-containing protein [Betaproteobacteria bacterium AqS2]|uniref:Trypsin-like peptidase domain-containing protein n=1 Tax=Candidatus Amphirhobacter heronislandensis TaxID=1732024 RepID=A0A930UBW9_9GAMM|nr:trypsin-like peptidase domain-containing protein [Betaproteobacteria bacterium AqS2]
MRGQRQARPRELWLLFAQTVTIVLALLFVYALVAPGGGFGREQPAAIDGQLSFSASLRRIMPSVVSIRTGGSDGPLADGFGIGSGVIVDAAGHILTNHHVIENSDDITVITGQGLSLDAEVLGSDPATDLAVLRVFPEEPLAAASFQDRRAPVQVGDVVMAVGSPYGLPSTASLGIVSAVGRSALGLSRYEHFIQTDAAINHGSSGGALTNVHGELVGISTALFAREHQGVYAQGIGFAIPAELAEAAYAQILAHGKFRRGWIGLRLGDINPLSARFSNVVDAWLVKGVEPNSPSERAGIEPGDLLLAINGRPPSQISFIEEATGELLRPGSEIELSLQRSTDLFAVTVRVYER